MTDGPDDLEWLEANWSRYYKGYRVGAIFYDEMVAIGGKSAREIIKEMREYQERGDA